jgi:hypothetical protein
MAFSFTFEELILLELIFYQNKFCLMNHTIARLKEGFKSVS